MNARQVGWRRVRLGCVLGGCLSLEACGGHRGQPAEVPKPEAAAPQADSDSPPRQQGWEGMNFDERKKYMSQVVVPKMGALFAKFAPAEYAGNNDDQSPKFGCSTCHGNKMGEVKFKMPNGVHPLPAGDPISAAREYDADATRFMLEQVVPKMLELLGEPPATSPEAQGRACFECHQKE